MARIITISNPKGGVGKTSVTINLGASLAVAEKKVLLLDFDPTGTVAMGLGNNGSTSCSGLFEFLLGRVEIKEAIHLTSLENLNYIPNNINSPSREKRFLDFIGNRNILQTKTEILLNEPDFKYDFILIDTPPLLNDFTYFALSISDSVIIPVRCDYYSLCVTEQFIEEIGKIKNGINPRISIEGIVLNFLEKETRESRLALREAKNRFNGLVLNTHIPKNTSIGYSVFQHKPVLLVDALSKGAVSYLALAKEILERSTVAPPIPKTSN